MTATEPIALHAPSSKPRFELLTIDQLLNRPDPQWLIEGLFEEQALGMLYGEPGSGKSFLALDWSLSIAFNKEWHGRKVKSGSVVYVVGEGLGGIKKRVKAWLKHHQVSATPAMRMLLTPVQVREQAELDAFLAALEAAEIKPALVVLDTFARSFAGGDENSAQEVGQWLKAAQRLQDAGVSVLLIHHSIKADANTERGSSALRGAVDTAMLLQKNGEAVTLICKKQKDHSEFDSIALRRQSVELDGDLDSCVLVPATVREPAAGNLNAGHRDALMVLASFPDATAPSGDWHKRIEPAIPERTFHNRRKALLNGGFIEEVSKNVYRVTAVGLAATATGLPLPAIDKAA